MLIRNKMLFSFAISFWLVIFGIVGNADALYSVSGTVTSEEGIPLEGVELQAVSTTSGGWATAYTNAEGTYFIDSLIDDLKYRIQAIPPDDFLYVGEYYTNAIVSSDATPIDINTTYPVDFQLQLGGYISGTVTAEDTGFPVSGALVSANNILGYSSRSNETDENGRYMIWGLYPGNYKIGVYGKEPYSGEFYDNTTSPDAATIVNVDSGLVSGFVDFQLTRAGAITGIIYNNQNGQPVQGVSVIANYKTYDANPYFSYEATSGADGRYLISNMAPGEYEVTASGGGLIKGCYGLDSICSRVYVNSGKTTGFIELYLDQGASISGIISSELGQPISNMSVAIKDNQSLYVLDACQTDSNGRYNIIGLQTSEDHKLLINSPYNFNGSNYSFLLLPMPLLTAPESIELNISLKPISDNDSDGLHDQWESVLGLDTSSNDSFEDKDMDGYCNLQEFFSATDPTDKFSIPLQFREVQNDGDMDGFEVIEIMKELENRCQPSLSFCRYDLNFDGIVDIIDLRLFAEFFGLVDSTN